MSTVNTPVVRLFTRKRKKTKEPMMPSLSIFVQEIEAV